MTQSCHKRHEFSHCTDALTGSSPIRLLHEAPKPEGHRAGCHFDQLRRREFIHVRRRGGVATRGAGAASERMRHIGVLMNTLRTIRKARFATWLSGEVCRNWAGPMAATFGSTLGRGRCRPHSQICRGIGCALAGRHPDRWHLVTAVLQATRTLPIVFVTVLDPVGAGFVSTWRGQAAMPPALPFSNTASARNGWSCSKRSHLA